MGNNLERNCARNKHHNARLYKGEKQMIVELEQEIRKCLEIIKEQGYDPYYEGKLAGLEIAERLLEGLEWAHKLMEGANK
jgi:hypothetical protein